MFWYFQEIKEPLHGTISMPVKRELKISIELLREQ